MTAPVDRSDLLRKSTGGDSGLGELIWVHKSRVSPGGTVITTTNGKPISYWEFTGYPTLGSPPGGTARNPTNATTGAVPFASPGGGRQKWLAAAHFCAHNGVHQSFLMCDRLADFSGLSGTSTSVQNTTSLSAARYTGAAAAGNQIGVELYSGGVGSTPRTLSVNYTNESGGASVGTCSLGTAGNYPRVQYSFVPVKMAAGDRGVRSIESVQLDGSTGTTGNFGVVIYRPLMYFGVQSSSIGSMAQELLTGPESSPLLIKDDACLFFWGFAGANTASSFDLGLQFVES